MSAGLYDMYMEYTKPFGGSLTFHRWSIISCISALQERKTNLPMGGISALNPNMYIILVGLAGSGKTVAADLATGLLKEYNRKKKNPAEHIYFAPDKITPARLLVKLEQSFHKEKNQSALYQYASELSSSILDIGGGSIVPDLLTLFDCKETFTKETMGGGVLDIQRPCFNLLGCTTTNFLGSFLTREQVGTGLAARIVFASDFTKYRFSANIPNGDRSLKQKMLGQIERIHKTSGDFVMDPKAIDVFAPWYEHVQDVRDETPDDTFMKDYLARKGVQVQKVAMALSIARDSSLVITSSDMRNAITFMEEIEPGLSRCFGVTNFRQVPDLALQILNKVPEDKWVRRGKLIRFLMDGGMSGRLPELDETINTLLEADLMTSRVVGDIIEYKKINHREE